MSLHVGGAIAAETFIDTGMAYLMPRKYEGSSNTLPSNRSYVASYTTTEAFISNENDDFYKVATTSTRSCDDNVAMLLDTPTPTHGCL